MVSPCMENGWKKKRGWVADRDTPERKVFFVFF